MIFTKAQLAFLTENFKILGGLPVILFKEQSYYQIKVNLYYICVFHDRFMPTGLEIEIVRRRKFAQDYLNFVGEFLNQCFEHHELGEVIAKNSKQNYINQKLKKWESLGSIH